MAMRLIHTAQKADIPKELTTRMLINVAIDFGVSFPSFESLLPPPLLASFFFLLLLLFHCLLVWTCPRSWRHCRLFVQGKRQERKAV